MTIEKILIQLILTFWFTSHLSASIGNTALPDRGHHQPAAMPVPQWEEIHLTWYNKFNPEKPNTAVLLRRKKWAHQHGLIPNHYNKKRIVPHGLPSEKTFISAVIPFYPARQNIMQKDSLNSNRVTGIYRHDTDNVHTWKLIDQKKNISIVHATPNHPFYVKNLKKFLPLKEIKPTMNLIDERQQIIHLVCPEQKNKKCWLPYHVNKISTVYNIEVSRKHQYFVSRQHILVHNCNNPSEKTHPPAPLKGNNYLVVSYVESPTYKERLFSEIDTFRHYYHVTLPPTYSKWSSIPRGRYNKVLVDTIIGSRDMLKQSNGIAGRLKLGARVYILEPHGYDSSIHIGKDLKTLKYSRMLTPEEGHSLLREFGMPRGMELVGEDALQQKKTARFNSFILFEYIKKPWKLSDTLCTIS